MELWIPYGETEIPVRVPDDNFYRILELANTLGAKSASSIVEDSSIMEKRGVMKLLKRIDFLLSVPSHL